jgi:hypothetical protein
VGTGDRQAVEVRGDALVESLQFGKPDVRRVGQRRSHDEEARHLLDVLTNNLGNDNC